MRNTTLMILLLLVLVSGGLLAASTLPAASDPPETVPVVFFPEGEYLFPAVAEGVQVVHDFVVRNTGDAELQIKRVITG